jgi:hypothetical protein
MPPVAATASVPAIWRNIAVRLIGNGADKVAGLAEPWKAHLRCGLFNAINAARRHLRQMAAGALKLQKIVQ